MTAPTEPVPVDGGRTPLEQLITTGQALIDEARAAIAEHQAPMVFTTLEHAVVDGPACITSADRHAAMQAAIDHTIKTVVADGWVDVNCARCGTIDQTQVTPVAEEHINVQVARHKLTVILEAAHVEVRRG